MLTGKVVIVTGASTGIGAELARRLGQEGAKVVLAARDEQRLDTLASEIKDSLVVVTDVTSESACKNLIDKTIERFGRLDILVNNAGVSMWALFDEITDVELFRRIMDVNYFGTLYCTYYALPHIKESRGQLVAVSSVTGKTGVPTRSGYAASKHAIEGLYNSLRIELMDKGVDITIISPGFVQSDVRINALGNDGKRLGTSHIDESNAMVTSACVDQMIDAIINRKRDITIAGVAVRLAYYVKPFFPKFIDNMAARRLRAGRT